MAHLRILKTWGWRVALDPRSPRWLKRIALVFLERHSGPEPSQKSLDTMIERAHAFRVMRSGVRGGRPPGDKVLFEGRDERLLAGLRHFLQIAGPTDSCFCNGDLAIEFLDQWGNSLAAISVQHRTAIRWSRWRCDAALVDAFGLVKWLAAQGVEYPLFFANSKATDSQREEGKKLARAVLDSRVTVREAAPTLFALSRTDVIAEERDKALVLAFESETEHLPIGDVRRLWAPYALEMKDAEFARAEARWREGLLEICKKLAEG